MTNPEKIHVLFNSTRIPFFMGSLFITLQSSFQEHYSVYHSINHLIIICISKELQSK